VSEREKLQPVIEEEKQKEYLPYLICLCEKLQGSGKVYFSSKSFLC
jgi:hypothetical protein